PVPHQPMTARKGVFPPMHKEMKPTPPFGPREGMQEMPSREQHTLTPREPKYMNPPFWRTPLFFRPYVLFLMTALLIVGINIAIKLLFKSLRDEQRMKDLQRQTLSSELEYLKHQINPHFFMNTLNNIHALIDIDTEKAKSTVLELSKMMRYVLYESSQPVVPLEKEIRFLDNYIQLMKIRYTDNIDIQVFLPTTVPPVTIPPLLFISFIENAFKHGISYRHKSFIRISLEIKDDQLHCLVINSSFDNVEEQHTGIGLENVSKRLNLLYNENYTLDSKSDENEYHVLLIIPIYP
ncbi:MAG: histidine kinase, partial [Tannerellaceae bacterium]|nr:histidine kinase [Tannerellaceae bacterium]